MVSESLRTLIDTMRRNGLLRTPRIAEAFVAIDRRLFVPEAFKAQTYEDRPLPIGRGQTISQPSTVAFMLELLQPQSGERVLDIGSGSGWTTALLGYLVGPQGRVEGLERQLSLVEAGRRHLAPLGFDHVRIDPADAVLGRPGETYDKILVSASASQVPQQLIDQLRPGGVLVIPIGHAIVRFEKCDDGRIEKQVYPGFVFVPLIT